MRLYHQSCSYPGVNCSNYHTYVNSGKVNNWGTLEIVKFHVQEYFVVLLFVFLYCVQFILFFFIENRLPILKALTLWIFKIL